MIKNFYAYSIFIYASIIVGICIQIYISAKKGFSLFDVLFYIGLECIGIAIGAKAINYFFYNPNNLDFFSVGLNSSGALLGAILMIILYCFIRKKRIISSIIIFILSSPLIYSIGKIGCFLSGCCIGFIYNGIGGVVYKYVPNPTNISYFPIQLIESIVFLMIFIFNFLKFKNKLDDKLLCSNTLIMCGILKFILDYFRLDHVSKIITINQLFCLLVVIVGFVIFCNRNKKIKN